MPDVPAAVGRGDLSFLDEDALAAFVVAQRWFGSKAQEVPHLGVLEAVPLKLEPPMLANALVEARFAPGNHEVYQLPLGLRADEEAWSQAVIARADGFTAYDALADPKLAGRLLELMGSCATVESGEAALTFHWVEDFPRPRADADVVRPMGGEQSNSSVVFDDALVLKAYRRIEAGINPELEVLRFLTERRFASIAPLAGWYEYTGRLMGATLGVLQEFLTSGRDGWELALEELSKDPDTFLERVHALGAVTGQMHAVLASAPDDPTFAPEEPGSESLALLSATVDEEIERLFLDLPDDAEVAPIAGRGEEVREQLRLLTPV
ncbi:MAG: hypothetical protein M3133_02795, partial [Actinomycetota bacterium]|nr:hypothetical protein [Actinomycetota bacterium]